MSAASWDEKGNLVSGPFTLEQKGRVGGFIPGPPSREEVEAMVRRIVREELERAGVEVKP